MSRYHCLVRTVLGPFLPAPCLRPPSLHAPQEVFEQPAKAYLQRMSSTSARQPSFGLSASTSLPVSAFARSMSRAASARQPYGGGGGGSFSEGPPSPDRQQCPMGHLAEMPSGGGGSGPLYGSGERLPQLAAWVAGRSCGVARLVRVRLSRREGG